MNVASKQSSNVCLLNQALRHQLKYYMRYVEEDWLCGLWKSGQQWQLRGETFFFYYCYLVCCFTQCFQSGILQFPLSMQFVKTVLTNTIKEKEVKPFPAGKKKKEHSKQYMHSASHKAQSCGDFEPVTFAFTSITWNLQLPCLTIRIIILGTIYIY